MLVAAREDSPYNSQQVAQLLGCKPSTYRVAEAGTRAGPAVMDNLAKAFPAQTAQAIRHAWLGEQDSDERLLGVIWPSGSRKYVSIDEIAMTTENISVEVKFLRLHPSHDRGLQWSGNGRIDAFRNILLSFTSDSNDGQFGSSGALVLTPRVTDDGVRHPYYQGKYLRPVQVGVDSDPIDVRVCNVYQKRHFPSQFMPAFAALDLDNTLYDGWSLFDWALSVRASGLQGIGEAREKFRDLGVHYKDGQISHDELAALAAKVYSDLANRAGTDEIAESAKAFARDAKLQSRFLPFAGELVAELRARLIAPVVITGAPNEIASALTRELDIDESHGFDTQNPNFECGSATGKVSTVRDIAKSSARFLELAAGDSASDLQILAMSPVRILHRALAHEFSSNTSLPTGTTLQFDRSTTGDVVARWLDAVLPDHATMA